MHMSSKINPESSPTEQPTARHYYPRLGWLEGAPNGLYEGYEYMYAGTPADRYPSGRMKYKPGDYIDFVYGGVHVQRRIASDALDEVKYLRKETREAIEAIIDQRIQAMAHLAAQCLEGMGADQSNSSHTTTVNYPGGPLALDASSQLWHRKPLEPKE